jgi:Polysaccharide pyruvyl transferase
LASSKNLEVRVTNLFIFGEADRVDNSFETLTEDAYNRTGQNLGNFAFISAIKQILREPPSFEPWHADPDALNGSYTMGIFPCANQLGPHADFGGLAARIAALKIGLVAVGLGAQGDWDFGQLPTVPEGTLRWVKEMADRSSHLGPNIGVRGPFTLRVLRKYGLSDRAIVTGCPSLFLSSAPNLGEKIAEKLQRPIRRIAVAAGHPGWKHLAKIERSLTSMMERSGGSYIVQSPVEMVHIARGEADLLPVTALEACRDYACPGMDMKEFSDWSRRYARAFFGVSEWMECLRAHDFVVGTRIHGVVLGLQAGIPGLCIAHDSRTRELCEILHVPFVMASDVRDGLEESLLTRYFSFDAELFDKNRRGLALRMINFLTQNNVPIGKKLGKIVE